MEVDPDDGNRRRPVRRSRERRAGPSRRAFGDTAISNRDFKKQTRLQWDGDPCGENTASGETPGSPRFYSEVRRHRYEEYAPWMDEAIPFSDLSEKRILEIGVGLGSDHYRFAAAGNQLFCIDLSPVHLAHTRRHLGHHDLVTRPVRGDAEALPFADANFDLVYAFGALHHTPNPGQATSEIHRVLRPGGEAIITVYHAFSWFFMIQTLLYNGVVKGGLWKKGWRKLLSEIEYRDSGNTAVPLVEVYSRRRTKRLFSEFDQVNIETHHVQPQDFAFLGPLLRGSSRARLERRLGFGGWYLLARARKAMTPRRPPASGGPSSKSP